MSVALLLAACGAVELGQHVAPADGGVAPDARRTGDDADASSGSTSGSCDKPSDCDGGPVRLGIGSCYLSSGFYCVNHTCIWTCAGQVGHACTVDESGPVCKTCPTAGLLSNPYPGPYCTATTCVPFAPTMRVSDSSCPSFPRTNDSVALSSDATCTFQATRSGSGDPLGTITILERSGSGSSGVIANIPALGGICTGFLRGTDSESVVLSCPQCQFELVP